MTEAVQTKAMEAVGLQLLFAEELSANDATPIPLQGFSPAHTVRDLKRVIAERGQVQSLEGIQVVFAGAVMEDGRSTSVLSGVFREKSLTMSSGSVAILGDTIYFVRSATEALPPYQGPETIPNLFFHDLDGKPLTLHHLPVDMKMSDVFEKLGREKAIETEWLRFIWSGKQLEGSKLSRKDWSGGDLD